MFNSEPERDLARRLYGIPEARCTVVGMGLDPFEADADAFAARQGLRAPYLFYAGRREPLKGTPLLLDYVHAFRERTGKDLELVFAGSGPLEPPPGPDPHVHDIGFVQEQEKHEAMAGALAFCHPSVNESFGIVVLESWLARTPALVHAGSEVLQWQCRRSGGGLWFRTYPEFEEELLLLLNDEALRGRMGASGRRFVLEEYAWPRVEERFFDALGRLQQ
jgi:glycosyltransferase involved in cell wall biosynthesis